MPAAGRFVQRAGAGKSRQRPRRPPSRGVRSAMEITRKSFLSGAAAGLAGLSLLPAAAWAAPATETETGILWLRNAAGQTFTARSADGALVTLLLEKVEELKSGTDVEQYRLLFSADGNYRLAEGTWRLGGSRGRRAGDVFLVPAGTNAAGRALYRADFCLLAKLVPETPRR